METYHLRRIKINDIQLSDKNAIVDGTLYVNAPELRSHLLEDRYLKGVKLEVARPGESVRIVPVKDILEPRARLDEKEDSFIGTITDANYQAGLGTCIVLDGACVVTSGNMVNFQEGLIDMTGPGSEFCLFSKK